MTSCGACGASFCGGCGAWYGGGAFAGHLCSQPAAMIDVPSSAGNALGLTSIAETRADLHDLQAHGQGATGRAADDRRRLRNHYVGLGVVAAIVLGIVLAALLH